MELRDKGTASVYSIEELPDETVVKDPLKRLVDVLLSPMLILLRAFCFTQLLLPFHKF
jgi:hypothetical protein